MVRIADRREAGLSGIANGFWRRSGGFRGPCAVPSGWRSDRFGASRSPPPSHALGVKTEARAARISAENDGLRDELWRLKEAASARDRAEAASEAKSRFLTTMSHEIRTPISGILGMADLLREASLDPENASCRWPSTRCTAAARSSAPRPRGPGCPMSRSSRVTTRSLPSGAAIRADQAVGGTPCSNGARAGTGPKARATATGR